MQETLCQFQFNLRSLNILANQGSRRIGRSLLGRPQYKDRPFE